MMIETLNIIFSCIESIGVVVTLGLTSYTLYQNTKLSLKEQKSEILTHKRSQRIDMFRTYSSTILAEGELRILDKEVNESALIYATYNYVALLQYIQEYTEDIKLINLVHEVKRMILDKNCDKKALKHILNELYLKTDCYISIEYSRLIQEVESQTTLDNNAIESQKEEFKEQERKYSKLYKEIEESGIEVIF